MAETVKLPDWCDLPPSASGENRSLLRWAMGEAEMACRYFVAYGGRGGTKSIASAILINLWAEHHPGEVFAVLRQKLNALNDGAINLIYEWSKILGMNAHKPDHTARIDYPNGCRVIARGASQNLNSLRGLETISGAWFEEAEPITEQAFVDFDPTLRKMGTKPLILITFNPDRPDAYMYRTFVESEAPNSIVVKVNYDAYYSHFMNPAIDNAIRLMLATDKESYPHTYLGHLKTARGAVFQPHRIKEEQPFDKPDRVVRAWDLAASDGTGDYTVGVKMAIKRDDEGTHFQIQDMIRGQWDVLRVRREVSKAASEDGKHVYVVIEIGGGDAGKQVERMWRELLLGSKLRLVHPTGSKVERATPLAGALNGGMISRVEDTGWWRDMASELAAFSEDKTEMKGIHDDIVDSLAHGFNFLVARKHRESWVLT